MSKNAKLSLAVVLLFAVIVFGILLIQSSKKNQRETNDSNDTPEQSELGNETYALTTELSRDFSNIYDLGDFIVGANFYEEGLYAPQFYAEGEPITFENNAIKNWDLRIVDSRRRYLCVEYTIEEKSIDTGITHIITTFNTSQRDLNCEQQATSPILTFLAEGNADQRFVFSFVEKSNIEGGGVFNEANSVTPVTPKNSLLTAQKGNYNFLIQELSEYNIEFNEGQWEYTIDGQISYCRDVANAEVIDVKNNLKALVLNIVKSNESNCNIEESKNFSFNGNIEAAEDTEFILMFQELNRETL